MRAPGAQGGFSLVSAIFVIVVLAGVVGYMLQVSTVQLTTTGQGIDAERAYRAAQGGIQWAVSHVLDNSTGSPHSDATTNCNIVDGAGFALNGYAVTLECDTYLFSDPTPRSIYQVTATATRGTIGTPDFVSRAVEVSFSQPPP
ncbi:hypothetical protein H0Z60_08945 [Ectothiorhodospiraceae bacterium WFHF3C12]|nr:hypothetical protein [Ectothiorhodospiraceae bacterium WFHF3C12]